MGTTILKQVKQLVLVRVIELPHIINFAGYLADQTDSSPCHRVETMHATSTEAPNTDVMDEFVETVCNCNLPNVTGATPFKACLYSACQGSWTLFTLGST